MDLTGLAKIRWRTKQTGFRSLRLTLKLANGMWLVSDYADGPTVDWHESVGAAGTEHEPLNGVLQREEQRSEVVQKPDRFRALRRHFHVAVTLVP